MENAHHSHCYIQKELDAELLLSLAKPSTSLQKFETLIKAVNYTPTMESLAKAAVKILGNNKRPAPIHPSEHLSKNELESIFVSAATNSNILRAKRDLVHPSLNHRQF